MNNKIFLGLFAASLALTACKKDLEPQESSAPVATADAATPAATPAAPAQMQPAANLQPQTAQTVQTAATAQVAPGMNPAHGQPGHRCDIAVGAPLNSPPGNTQAQKPTMTINPNQTAAPAMVQTTPAPTKTAPGMNPPHGQPGHRCDIAVGQPLTSAPAAPTQVAIPAATTTPASAPASEFTVSEPEKKAE